MEAEMKMVFQQKVAEKEAKLKQSEEELYARHREMKEALERQRADLEDKKRRLESGRPLTPEGKGTVSHPPRFRRVSPWLTPSSRLFSLLTEEATWVPWWKIDDLRMRKSQPIPLHNPHARSLGSRDSICVDSSSGFDGSFVFTVPGSVWIHCSFPYTRLTSLTRPLYSNYGGLLHSLLLFFVL